MDGSTVLGTLCPRSNSWRAPDSRCRCDNLQRTPVSALIEFGMLVDAIMPNSIVDETFQKYCHRKQLRSVEAHQASAGRLSHGHGEGETTCMTGMPPSI
jgi:hypothetical protein